MGDDRYSLNSLEADLHVPQGFLLKLTEEDWSFIIKTYALIESAAAHLLVNKFNDNRIQESLFALPLSGQKHSKINILSALELLPDGTKQYVESLSKIRNKLVHDVSNVQFDLVKYVAELGKDKLSGFKSSFGQLYLNEIIEIGDNKVKRDDFIMLNPKLAIWRGAIMLLQFVNLGKEQIKLKQQEEEMYMNTFQALVKIKGKQ